jgi:hypothetical protein
MSNQEIILEGNTLYCTDVDEVYESMGEGARCHMSNKLWKEGYRSPKATDRDLAADVARLQREFEILDSACDFWHDTAMQLGYEE